MFDRHKQTAVLTATKIFRKETFSEKVLQQLVELPTSLSLSLSGQVQDESLAAINNREIPNVYVLSIFVYCTSK